MIKEFKSIFTNQLSKHSIMNVKPATFTLKKNVEIPNNNLTAHFPPANLRDSADRLLDKLEQGGLIKKAPRVTRYKSKAFFKAKKNNEARLLVDYKASQVNNLLERPTHPQFSVEQLIQQEPSFAILYKKDQKEGTSPPSSHTGVNIFSPFSHKAALSHRISSEQPFLKPWTTRT